MTKGLSKEAVEAMVTETMDRFNVSRSTAAQFADETLQLMVVHPGDPVAVYAAFKSRMEQALLNKEPWAVEYSVAEYRRNLPEWTQVSDKAREEGRDPVTDLVMQLAVPENAAREMVVAVELSKAGHSVEEIIDLMVNKLRASRRDDAN